MRKLLRRAGMPTTAMWAMRRSRLTGRASVLDTGNHAGLVTQAGEGRPSDPVTGKSGSVRSSRESIQRIAAYMFIYAAYGVFALILAWSVFSLIGGWK